MYRYSNGQISLADFKQPVDMNLKESNRWVKAQTIPLTGDREALRRTIHQPEGNVVKPLHLALEVCIIQAEYGYSDEETALRSRKTHIFNISAGILAMMTKSCP